MEIVNEGVHVGRKLLIPFLLISCIAEVQLNDKLGDFPSED